MAIPLYFDFLGNYSMMDQPFIQGPPGRGAPRGPMQSRLQGPWIEVSLFSHRYSILVIFPKVL